MIKVRLIINNTARIIAKVIWSTVYRATELTPNNMISNINLYGSVNFNDALGAMNRPHIIPKSSGEPIPKTYFPYTSPKNWKPQ